jgi:hypothetical protein
MTFDETSGVRWMSSRQRRAQTKVPSLIQLSRSHEQSAFGMTRSFAEYLFEEVQGQVDVLGLLQDEPLHVRLAHSLGPGQIHQVQLGPPDHVVAGFPSLDAGSEDAVAKCRGLIHGRGADHAVGVPQEEQVQGFLLVPGK